ncbi:MAG: putative acetyltransferase [Candidatus Carbobacillus altaicus]|uniref:Putative acetyltransferase n=1 Tax=Candidatus Carbonibacillus altaicus TaxID=2163959 RepID=A0A2R6XXI0_9BACL|nr:MAG: putative acetyltransferase [Candidatus Carbobacillus altaicus]
MNHFVDFDPRYAPQLVDLWNRAWVDRFPMRQELFVQNSIEDMNVLKEGSLIALDPWTEEAIGLVISKKLSAADPYAAMLEDEGYEHAGWIQVLLVDQRYRHRGLGSNLLSHAERALASNGARKIILGGDPWHYFPAVPADDDHDAVPKWFQKRGYQAGKTYYDLLCHRQHMTTVQPHTMMSHAAPSSNNRSTWREPADRHPTYRLLRLDEKDRLLAFMQKVFPGRWTYEAYHYFLKGGKGREILVVEKDDNIVGFCRLHDDQSPFIAQNVSWAPLFPDRRLGGVGPLGLELKARGAGYGLSMVSAALEELFQRGIEYVVIDWTDLVEFYQRLGCSLWRRYIYHEKIL